MTSLPLFHVNAPAYSVMGSLSIGAGLVLLPQFSARGFIDAARRHGATEFNAIGAMLEILMRQPPRADDADTALRLCYTGPSPAKDWQLEFERRFALRIVCGYAMSESPYGLIWPHGARPYGTLGTTRQHPVHGHVNDARVIDDAGQEMAAGGSGELLLRNPVVTPGYWEMPEETARVIVDGWLHTGDLGTVDADGFVTITGRKKDIIITSGGKNIAPAELENQLRQARWISQALVYGDRRPYPVALVTLDPEEILPWARDHGLPDDPVVLATHPRVRELVQSIVDSANEQVSQPARIKRFAILSRDFTLADGELTPTLKLKRAAVHANHAALIEELYGQG